MVMANARTLIEAETRPCDTGRPTRPCDRCGRSLDEFPSSVYVCPRGYGCSGEAVTERDDLAGLPLSKEAKSYARRSGLKAMTRQPKDFWKVNHQTMNPTRRTTKFKNRDEGNGSKTDGATTTVPKAMKF